MKVLAFGDSQIGAIRHNAPGPRDDRLGWPVRALDLIRAVGRVMDVAIEQDVDLILECGDLFDHPSPAVTQQLLVWEHLLRPLELGIPIVSVAGNHGSWSNPNLATAGAMFYHDLYSQVTEPMVVHEAGIAVAVLPWLRETDATERAMGFLAQAEADVLMGHLTIPGATSPTGWVAELGRDFSVPIGALTQGPWRAVVLAHIHTYQVLHEDPPVIYCGSTEWRTTAEAAEPHGCVLLDLPDDGGPAPYRFIPIPTRPYHRIGFEPHDDHDTVMDLLGQYGGDEAVVQLVVRVAEGERPPVTHAEVAEALYAGGAFYVMPLQVEAIAPDASEDDEGPQVSGLGPLEQLEAWYQRRGLEEEAVTVRVEATRGLMRELEEAG